MAIGKPSQRDEGRPRVVTLAQLAELPLGTVISPINYIRTEEGVRLETDVQGTLQLRPTTVLRGVDDFWIHTVDELPDLSIEDGRLYSRPSEHTYSRDTPHPWRFVVWSTPE